MKDDIFVIDGIAHAMDMRPEAVLPLGQVLRDINIGVNQAFPDEVTPPGADAYDALPSADHMSNAYFLESDVDLAVTHHLPLYSYVKGGLVTIESNYELYQRAPQRWIVYAGIDPTAGVAETIRAIDEQLELVPTTVGVKIYPAQLDPLRTVDMSDKDLYPIWQHVQDRGLSVVAVHKAVPYGPVPINPFRVADVEGAAGAFPDLNFEIMHGGMAFTEETALMIGRFPNVFVNLEGTSMTEYLAPAWFERVLAEFIFRGGADKIIWATGGPQFAHPQFFLDRFMAFQFSEAVMKEWPVGPITDDQRADMLGRTFARMIDLDIDAAKAQIADDEYARAQRDGLDAPFANWEQLSGDVTTPVA